MRGFGKIIVSICERARIVLCIVALMAGLAVPALLVSAEEEAVTGTATVTADSLNVRSGPGKDYDAIGKLYSGNVVEVVALDGEWLKIKYNDTTGYIALEYAEFEPDEVEEEVVEEEQPTEATGEAAPEEEAETETIAGVSRYKVVFGLIGAIAVLMLIILFTIKSIKKLDEEDDDDEYEDEEGYEQEEEYYEDEYDGEYEEEYEDDEEGDDDDEYEYEYITVRRPKQGAARQTPQKQTGGTDDFLVNIDPKYFE